MDVNLGTNIDSESKAYINKIQNCREKQIDLIPLFLHAKQAINKHKKCLKVILNESEDSIPFQLMTTLNKGQEGLQNYAKLLDNIDRVLQKN